MPSYYYRFNNTPSSFSREIRPAEQTQKTFVPYETDGSRKRYQYIWPTRVGFFRLAFRVIVGNVNDDSPPMIVFFVSTGTYARVSTVGTDNYRLHSADEVTFFFFFFFLVSYLPLVFHIVSVRYDFLRLGPGRVNTYNYGRSTTVDGGRSTTVDGGRSTTVDGGRSISSRRFRAARTTVVFDVLS